jgi:hypothetical protein
MLSIVYIVKSQILLKYFIHLLMVPPPVVCISFCTGPRIAKNELIGCP